MQEGVIRDLISLKRDALGGEALPDFAGDTFTDDIKPRRKPGFISQMVGRVDNMPDKERIAKDYIHVSSMVDWCPRKYAIQARSDKFYYTHRSVMGAQRVMWELGKAAERHVRDSFIRSVDYRGVFGIWTCVCKRTEHPGFHDEKKTCGVCRGKLNTYKEFTIFDDHNHVSGNPDLLIARRKLIYPVEIKSLTNSTQANEKKRGFDTITAPFGDHIFQVDSYHHLIERNLEGFQGLLPGNKVIVMYVNKEYKWGIPYKEYHLRAVEPQRKTFVRKEFAKAKGVWESIHTPKAPLPKRTLCPNQHCSRAKYCPVVQECFARP